MRKIIFLTISLLTILYSCANKNGEIEITAEIKNYPDSTMVVLMNFETNRSVDTTYIINNKFNLTLSNTTVTPHGIFIGNNRPEYLFLFIEDVDIIIFGEKGKMKYAKVEGGKMQKQSNDFFISQQRNEMRKDSLQKEMMTAMKVQDTVKLKEIGKQQIEIIQEGISNMASYVEENPNQLFSAFILKGLLAGLPKSEIKSLHENLSSTIKESNYGKSIAQWLELHKDVNIGDIAENFTLPDINGKNVRLNDFQGKFVLVEFWKVGCSGCMEEHKDILKEYEKYQGKNFEIISIAGDKNVENLKLASQKMSIAWYSLQDIDSKDGNVASRYGVTLVPSNFLIDPTGRIIAKNIKGRELEGKLKEIL